MVRSILAFILITSFSFSGIGQNVTAVSYHLKFNESNCRHEVHLVIDAGSTSSLVSRIQANSQMSIVTPSESTISIVETFNPKRLSGGQPINWNISAFELSPSIDPHHNYYGITPSISPTAIYDPLVNGDTIHLYDIVMSTSINGPEGIRFYENGIDLNAMDGLGGDFSNGFTIGSNNQLYNLNAPQDYPIEYASMSGPKNIYPGYETAIIPTTGGAWTNSDNSVSTRATDGSGTVTGVAEGISTYTFTPSSGCTTAASVRVAPMSDGENVAIGSSSPHPSAILDITSTNKGVLIPRMSEVERETITSPAEGLLVFQNNGNRGFYYFDGNNWRVLLHEEVMSNLIQPGSGQQALKKHDDNLESIKQKQAELEIVLTHQSKEIDKLVESLDK